MNSSQFNKEIQRIADKVKTDVEKELQKVFEKYETTNKTPAKKMKKAQKAIATSYSTEAEEEEHCEHENQLATYKNKNKPISNWLSTVDNFFKGGSLFEDFFEDFEDPFSSQFASIEDFTKGIEKHFSKGFEELEDELEVDPENTAFFMKEKVNNNGHVRVKTIKKLPKSDWETRVEEYNQGKPALENKKKKLRNLKYKGTKLAEIEEKPKVNNSIEIEDVTHEPVDKSGLNKCTCSCEKVACN